MQRYDERLGGIRKAVTNCRDKLDWCWSEPSADLFGIESKLDTLQAVAMAIDDAESKLADLRASGDALATVCDRAEERNRIEADVQATVEQLSSLRDQCEERRRSVDESNDLLRRFETTSESLSSWLRDVEARIRNETVSQTELTGLKAKIAAVTELQTDMEEHKPELEAVARLSEQVVAVMPESHVAHFSHHLGVRFNTALRFIESALTKQLAIEASHDEYTDAVESMGAWLRASDEQLRVHDKDVTAVPGAKPSLAYQSKLQALKLFMEQKDQGQTLLNRAVHAGDALMPNITSDDKTAIRTVLRSLRDHWEAHLDQVNALYKRVEGIILQLSSFDDSCRQIRRWIEETRVRLSGRDHDDQNGDDSHHTKMPTEGHGRMQELKDELQSSRILAQDVQSHRSLVDRLRERLREISNPDAAATVEEIDASYCLLVKVSQERVASLEKQAADYDAFACSVETFHDWLTGLRADLTLSSDTADGSGDRSSVESKLRVLDGLLSQNGDGEQLLERCQNCLQKLIGSTADRWTEAAREVPTDEFETQRSDWASFLDQCSERKERLQSLCSRWATFEDTARTLGTWLRQAETRVQDQALKATAPAKEAHLAKLLAAQQEIHDLEPQFAAAQQLGQSMEAAALQQVQMPQMVARHQALAGAVREQISRYQSYVKEHQDFNVRHAELVRYMEQDVADRLNACREIVGDYKILQERRTQLEALQERRSELDRQLDALSELAERLYVHTGPDGREMLRVQLKVIRERWEEICDDLTSTASKLDECLQKFAQFSAGQEQLTRWLRDVEQSMQQHSDLKSTLQEKRAQLQSHRIVHQEILGHHQLVDQVCSRAQELIDETLDKSLEVYIASIRQLFTSICAKSVELMGRLETCVTDHSHLSSKIKSLQDWIGSLRDETRLLCDSLAGEKTETLKRIRELEELRTKREPAGRRQMEELNQLCSTVLTSTSPRGCDLLAKTLAGLNDEMDSTASELQDGLKTHQSILQRWHSFDDGLEAMNAWLRTQQEAALGDQPLQVTLADKEARLAHLQAVRDVITGYEPQIDIFVDQATTLLQSSGVERLRAPVALVSSRYQQLHVASQEVVSKWRGLVEDHRLCNYKHFVFLFIC